MEKTPTLQSIKSIIFVLDMKLIDVLTLALTAALMIIGIHQIMVNGFGQSYWIIMLATALFFIYTYRKRQE